MRPRQPWPHRPQPACGEHGYGDRRELVESDSWHDSHGPSFQTCVNYGNVCRKFETNPRRLLLSFTHHADVAHLPPDEADHLLDWCEETREATGKPRPTRELYDEVRRRQIARMSPRTFGSIEAEKVAVALTIAPSYEPGSEYVLLPLPVSPHHEPEVRQQLGEPPPSPAEVTPRPAEPIDEFKALVRYAEARLPPDATPATFLQALEFMKQAVGRLTKRLRQSGGDPGDAVVVNLR